jgi:hypothetical protein
MEGARCWRPKGHDEHHATPVDGEPPLTWRDDEDAPADAPAAFRCAKCKTVAVYRHGAQCAACNASDAPKPSARLVSSASAMAATLKEHLLMLRRLEAGDPVSDEELTAAREVCESVLMAAGVFT